MHIERIIILKKGKEIKMKVLKAYGKANEASVYINGVKALASSLEDALFFYNTGSYGYGASNQVVIFGDDEEKKFVDSDGIKDFSEVEVPYCFYKELSKLPGNGYLRKNSYNEEAKTIKISYKED